MNRRDFLPLPAAVAATAASVAMPGLALAQGAAFVEGTHFVRLSTPAPQTLPAGKKIDVVEFFWYGCPACNAFEPTVEAWSKRLAADVNFRQVHVGFTAVHQMHQKLHATLDELAVLPTLHRRVFAAMHLQNKRLMSEGDMAEFMAANGVDSKKFLDTYKGFAVNTKASRAKALTDAYKIDGVPAIGVQGRWFTTGSLAGGFERMTQVADFLIQRSRTLA